MGLYSQHPKVLPGEACPLTVAVRTPHPLRASTPPPTLLVGIWFFGSLVFGVWCLVLSVWCFGSRVPGSGFTVEGVGSGG